MKIKKSYAIYFIITVAILAVSYFIYVNNNVKVYQFEGNTLNYAQQRGKATYEMSLKEENESYKIYRLKYDSRPFMNFSTKIYGLFYMPKNKENEDIPAVIFLPGGGGSKESRAIIAEFIAKEGYAAFIIDQRGIGETGGYYLSLEEDYKVSAKGNEPTQHLAVFDVLRAYDVLSKIEGIDKNNILVSGESMGGRSAIIAASIDQRIKGVIGISTSGLHVKDENQPYTPYLISIDPDHYASKISPRYLIMIHSNNDTLITPKSAGVTYNLANEPKKMFLINECNHGYCKEMGDTFKEAMKIIFEN